MIRDILGLNLNSEVKKRWDNFCNKGLNYELNFAGLVNIIIDFISPHYDSIIEEDDFLGNWDFEKRKYEKLDI